MVLEVHLHNFITESEHDGMLGPHPLLHVHLVALVALFRHIDISRLCLGWGIVSL